MISKKLIPVLSIFILLFGCSQKININKDSDAIRPDLNSVSILFPHVIYYEKHGEEKILKPGHSLFVSKNVADIIKEIIETGKYLPKTAIIQIDTMVTNQYIPQHFIKSIAYYTIIDDSIQVPRNEKRIFPVTPELKSLVDRVDTKYFIFISGTALGVSDAKKQFDVLQAQTYELFYDAAFSYDYQWYSLQLNIYIVDKESNEILWYRGNDARYAKYNPLKKGDVKSLCVQLLK